MTYEEIMARMLDSVPDDIDKREDKSLIWHTLGPSAAMMAETWAYGDNIHDGSIPDNKKCADDVLTRKCAEHGVNRYPASRAVRRGIFTDFNGNPASVNSGDRFGAEGLTYMVHERISSGEYQLVCEQYGIIGNNYYGAILPLSSAHQLGSATLADVLIPGADEETDDALRARYYIEVNALPFGGNVDQYLQWVKDIPGVGDARIFPTPNNMGGRVHIVVVAPENKPASQEFLDLIEVTLDPEPKSKGMGTAPIGHYVTVSTVEEVQVNVSAILLLQSGFSLESVREDVEQAVTAYLEELSFVDDTVRIAYIEAAVLGIAGVRDISATAINGSKANVTLSQTYDCYQVPILGALDLAEG